MTEVSFLGEVSL